MATRRPRSSCSCPDVARAQSVARIARTHLGLGTLATRHRDALDVHEHSVESVKRALEAAYDAGRRRR